MLGNAGTSDTQGGLKVSPIYQMINRTYMPIKSDQNLPMSYIFRHIKCQRSTIILSLGIKYSIHDLICIANNCSRIATVWVIKCYCVSAPLLHQFALTNCKLYSKITLQVELHVKSSLVLGLYILSFWYLIKILSTYFIHIAV